MSFRQGVVLPPPPQNEPLKSPHRLKLKTTISKYFENFTENHLWKWNMFYTELYQVIDSYFLWTLSIRIFLQREILKWASI